MKKNPATAGASKAVAQQVVELPEGVSLAEWALEKVRWQNPRIRCLLGCIRLLDDVLALLDVLDVDRRGLRGRSFFGLLADRPLRDTAGEYLPTASWERVSREAGVLDLLK